MGLLFDSLPELTDAVKRDPAADRVFPMLRWMLAGMGWGMDRIQNSFSEISGAL